MTINADGYDSLYDAAIDLQGLKRMGHDLWLTRCGHGAGFWDGDYGDYGDLITDIVSNNFNELHICLSDGKLYFE